jgi:hypothetical protein
LSAEPIAASKRSDLGAFTLFIFSRPQKQARSRNKDATNCLYRLSSVIFFINAAGATVRLNRPS